MSISGITTFFSSLATGVFTSGVGSGVGAGGGGGGFSAFTSAFTGLGEAETSACFKEMLSFGLFGCAFGLVVSCASPKMLLVFPPGGFCFAVNCVVVESWNIPLVFPPGGLDLFGALSASAEGPKILEDILCCRLETEVSSAAPKMQLDPPPGGFNTLELGLLSASRLW